MRRKDQLPDDPVIREVHEVRAKLWKETGGTIEGLMESVHRRVAKLRGRKKPVRGRRKGEA